MGCCGKRPKFHRYTAGQNRKCPRCGANIVSVINDEIDRVRKHHLAVGTHTVHIRVACPCGKVTLYSATIEKVMGGPRQ